MLKNAPLNIDAAVKSEPFYSAIQSFTVTHLVIIAFALPPKTCKSGTVSEYSSESSRAVVN